VASEIASSLEAAGLSVWWDRHINVGSDFSAEIEREIESPRAVVVLWSKASHDSPWVRDEAAYARDHKKLIPVQLDSSEPPLGFRQVQSLNLIVATGPEHKDVLSDLALAARRMASGDPSLLVAHTPTPHRSSRRLWFVTSAAVLLLVAIGWAIMQRGELAARELRDVFAVQDEIASAVAQALQIQLMGGVLNTRKGGTQNLDACLSYLRGVAALAQHTFRRTLELAPDFYWAHSWLGKSLLAQGQPDAALEVALKRPDETVLFFLAVALDAAGRKAEAEKALREQISRGADVHAYNIAVTYVYRRENDRAPVARACLRTTGPRSHRDSHGASVQEHCARPTVQGLPAQDEVTRGERGPLACGSRVLKACRLSSMRALVRA